MPTPPPNPTSGSEELDRDADGYEDGGEYEIDSPDESKSRETVRRLGERLFELDDLERFASEEEDACIVPYGEVLVAFGLWPTRVRGSDMRGIETVTIRASSDASSTGRGTDGSVCFA